MKTLIPLLLMSTTLSVSARPMPDQAQKMIANAPAEIKAVTDSLPEMYEFINPVDGKDTVSYTGQVFRNVLLSDLKSYMAGLKQGGYAGSAKMSENALNSYFKFRSNARIRSKGSINGKSRHRLSILDTSGMKRTPLEGKIYNAIQSPGKNLVDKIAGNDNGLRHGELKGWPSLEVAGISLKSIDADRDKDGFVEPEDLIQALFQVVSKNAATGQSFVVQNGTQEVQRITDANITPAGLHVRELVNKILGGAVSFSQAAGDYLSTDLKPGKGLSADNEAPYKGKHNYTALAHHWDEAFGYFGAARDFSMYEDIEIRKKGSYDTNADGLISIKREKNMGIAPNTARFDLASARNGSGTLDLSNDAFNAFLAGRALIHAKPAGYEKYVEAYAAIAIYTWERTLAASAIHYINATRSEMDEYGTPQYLFANHAKYWSEMKGFAMAFQFNPTSTLSAEKFAQLHQLIRDKPALGSGDAADFKQYYADLKKARNILRDAFGFTDLDAKAF